MFDASTSSRAELTALLARLSSDSDVLFAEEDKVAGITFVPDDPYYSTAGTWGQTYDNLYGLKKIGAGAAWDSSTGLGVTVAVVDTGIDYTHPDLANNIWINPNEVPGNGIDDDANGYIDDVRGWDFVGPSYWQPTSDADPADGHGHGTHVAGTIAAEGNNGIGIVGVAWQAKVMAVKGLDDGGSGPVSQLAGAIVYAADNGADVINASWGGRGSSQVIEEAVAYATSLGVVFVAAAGNSSDDARLYFPAGLANAITVAASDATDAPTYFSNFGPKIDVAAPGVDILSLRGQGTSGGTPLNEQYTRMSGTSMAAPHVAGVAALVIGQHPTYSTSQVRQALRITAEDPPGTPGFDEIYGYGRLNAAQAVLIDGALNAAIDLPRDSTRVTGIVDLTGYAFGSGFASYELAYGSGVSPSQWTLFYETSTPAGGPGPAPHIPVSGPLGVLDTSALADGLYTIQLTVRDGSGRAYVDRRLVVVDYVNITNPAQPVAPADASTLGTGTMVSIEGTARGASFSSYRIEWARGINPVTGWSTAGVLLEQGGTIPVEAGLLGRWDTAGISQADYYTIRVVVENNGFASETRTLVYLEPDLLTIGWPKRLNPLAWPTVEAYPARGAAGQRLLTIHTATSSSVTLLKFSADGSLEGTISDSASGYGVGQGAVVELDGEPGDDFLLPHWNFVRVFRGNGASYQLPTTAPFMLSNAVPVAEDLDGAGGPEILAVGSNSPAGTGRLFGWRADGTPLGGAFPVPIADANQELRSRGHRILVADLDGDGTKEIVVAEAPTATSVRLTLLSAEGTPRPWGAMPYEGELHRLAAGDVDGDGTLEVLALVRNPDFTRTLHVLGVDGAEKTGWPFVLENGESGLALADFDRDGKLEIVVPAAYKLYVFRGDGQPFSTAWPRMLSDASGIYYFGPPVTGDVDGDGIPEIVFASARNATAPDPLFPLSDGASVASGTSYYYDYKVMAMRRDGTLLRSWRVPTTAGQRVVGLAWPVLGDIDGNGETDIALTAPMVRAGESWIQDTLLALLTTRGTHTPAASDWPSQRRNSRNSAVFPGDLVAPSVSITSPQSGASIGGTITVSASASDNFYLRGVQFKVDGVEIGAEDVVAPFEVEWDPRPSGNGQHVLTAIARDAAGNHTTSAAVNVTVETDVTAPTVAIASPTGGTIVSSPTTVVVNAADPGGIDRVELYVDGVLAGTDTSAPYELPWDPRSLADGQRTLVAKAFDAEGNAGTSEAVDVVVNVAPQLAWSHPTPGMVVSLLIGLIVEATDNSGVTRVEFYANDVLVATDTAAPWATTWDAAAMVDGPYTFRAVAYDVAGNAANASVSVTVKNLPKPFVTSPAASSTVTGPTQVTATATDPGGIASVELLVNGVAVGSDSEAPYVFNWDPSLLADGWHNLSARAYDAAGNAGTSPAVSVKVAIAPAAVITAPLSGAVLAGTTTVTADAADNVGVVRTELFVDGVLALTDTVAPWSFALNTLLYGDGPHTLTLKAYDAAGNIGTSAAVAVTTDNDLASYDPVLRAPKCSTVQASCSSGSLLNGRSVKGPEPNFPNTINASCSDGTSGTYHYDESNDRIVVSTLDGSPLAAGKTARITATVWAYAGYTSDKLDLYYTATAQSPVWTLIGTFTPAGPGAQTITANYTLPMGTLQAVRARFRYAGTAAPCGTGGYEDHDDLIFAVETPVDSGPPTVAITSPASGSNVTGAVAVAIDATDDLGVTKVELYNGAALVGTDTTAPYAITWSPTVDGGSTLTAKAYDGVGNVTTSAAVPVTVAIPPAVSVTSPAAGAVVNGTVTITAQASDNAGVNHVEFFVDGALRSTDSTSPYGYTWDTASETAGNHTLTAKAYDLAGNTATSTPVTVQVQLPGVGDAAFDAVLRAPRCSAFSSVCDSGTLLVGRSTRGPEPNFPNTINNSCADGASGTFHSDESNDRIRVTTLDGTDLAGGKTVRIEATVWAYSSYSSDKLDLYYAANANAPVWTLITTLTPTKAGSQVLSATYTLPAGSSLQAVRANFRYSGSPSACTTGPYDDRDDLVFAVRPPQ